MKSKALHIAFLEAVEKVSEATQEFPPDVLLQFYSLYKQATQEYRSNSNTDEHELVSAFKINALFQVKDMSSDDAKEAYIEISEKYL